MIDTPKKTKPFGSKLEKIYVRFAEPADEICQAVRRKAPADNPTIALLKTLVANKHGTLAPHRIQPRDALEAHTLVITTTRPDKVIQSLSSTPFVRLSKTLAGLKDPSP